MVLLLLSFVDGYATCALDVVASSYHLFSGTPSTHTWLLLYTVCTKSSTCNISKKSSSQQAAFTISGRMYEISPGFSFFNFATASYSSSFDGSSAVCGCGGCCCHFVYLCGIELIEDGCEMPPSLVAAVLETLQDSIFILHSRWSQRH